MMSLVSRYNPSLDRAEPMLLKREGNGCNNAIKYLGAVIRFIEGCMDSMNEWKANLCSTGVIILQKQELMGERRQSNRKKQTVLMNGQGERKLVKGNKYYGTDVTLYGHNQWAGSR